MQRANHSLLRQAQCCDNWDNTGCDNIWQARVDDELAFIFGHLVAVTDMFKFSRFATG